MKPDELLTQLRERVAKLSCPECGASGQLDIREKWVPRTLPEILGARTTYGPKGMPLFVWCSACNTGGRVMEDTTKGKIVPPV